MLYDRGLMRRRPLKILWIWPLLLGLLLCWQLAKSNWLPVGASTYHQILGWGLGSTNQGNGMKSLGSGLLAGLVGFDTRYLPGILEKGLPVACAVRSLPANAPPVNSEQPDQPLVQPGAEQQPILYDVAIYHTHNAESYVPSQGQSKLEGHNGGVSVVGDEVTKVLEEKGIRVVHDLTIHDYPDFPTSYIHSAVTAQRLVKDNPNLSVLMDLHRDAGLPQKETAIVNGQTVARIMLIVGNSDQLPNPHWRDNYAFAQKIGHLLETHYPGVLKGVRLKDGRFNQHISKQAILVEVGSDKNTLEEAEGAGRCLGEVLAEIVKQMKTGSGQT
jgi:stage II sporulation protein P